MLHAVSKANTFILDNLWEHSVPMQEARCCVYKPLLTNNTINVTIMKDYNLENITR